jgi:hypothetical protein
MADNIAVTEGSGKTVATDDVGGAQYQRIKVDLGGDGAASPLVRGQQSTANSMPVALSTEQETRLRPNLIHPVDATFTRPSNTTAYAVGDLVANSTTAGSVTPLSFTGATLSGSGGSGFITGGVLTKSGSVACSIRAHFLKTSHAVTNGDNGLLVFTSLDPENYIGYIDFDFEGSALTAIGTSSAEVANALTTPIPYVLASGDTLYVFFQAKTAFTPANAGVFVMRPVLEVVS